MTFFVQVKFKHLYYKDFVMSFCFYYSIILLGLGEGGARGDGDEGGGGLNTNYKYFFYRKLNFTVLDLLNVRGRNVGSQICFMINRAYDGWCDT